MQLLSEVGRHVVDVGGEVHIHGFQQLTLDSVGLVILCHMSIVDLETVLFLDKVGEVEAILLVDIRIVGLQFKLWLVGVVLNQVVLESEGPQIFPLSTKRGRLPR